MNPRVYALTLLRRRIPFDLMIHSQKLRASVIAGITFLILHTMQLRGDTVIDLRKGDDLKVLFDGGLRPWRILGLERTHLAVGPSNIVLILSTGETFSVPVERATFTFLDGNRLASCELFGRPTQVEEAAALTRNICAAVAEPVSGLDQVVGSLGTMPNPSKYWTVHNISRGDTSLQVTFQPLYGFQAVTASVRVFLEWKRSPAEINFSSEPIKPPRGYEDVSLEPPKGDPNIAPFPKHGPDYYRKLTAAAKLLNDTQPIAPLSIPATPIMSEPVAPAAGHKAPVWPWVVGILTLFAIVAFVLKRRA